MGGGLRTAEYPPGHLKSMGKALDVYRGVFGIDAEGKERYPHELMRHVIGQEKKPQGLYICAKVVIPEMSLYNGQYFQSVVARTGYAPIGANDGEIAGLKVNYAPTKFNDAVSGQWSRDLLNHLQTTEEGFTLKDLKKYTELSTESIKSWDHLVLTFILLVGLKTKRPPNSIVDDIRAARTESDLFSRVKGISEKNASGSRKRVKTSDGKTIAVTPALYHRVGLDAGDARHAEHILAVAAAKRSLGITDTKYQALITPAEEGGRLEAGVGTDLNDFLKSCHREFVKRTGYSSPFTRYAVAMKDYYYFSNDATAQIGSGDLDGTIGYQSDDDGDDDEFSSEARTPSVEPTSGNSTAGPGPRSSKAISAKATTSTQLKLSFGPAVGLQDGKKSHHSSTSPNIIRRETSVIVIDDDEEDAEVEFRPKKKGRKSSDALMIDQPDA